jgi:hypothetical protein
VGTDRMLGGPAGLPRWRESSTEDALNARTLVSMDCTGRTSLDRLLHVFERDRPGTRRRRQSRGEEFVDRELGCVVGGGVCLGLHSDEFHALAQQRTKRRNGLRCGLVESFPHSRPSSQLLAMLALARHGSPRPPTCVQRILPSSAAWSDNSSTQWLVYGPPDSQNRWGRGATTGPALRWAGSWVYWRSDGF